MTKNDRFSDHSSFADEPSAIPWPENVRRPSFDDPLYFAFKAAVYGYELNGNYWRINSDGEPEPVIS